MTFHDWSWRFVTTNGLSKYDSLLRIIIHIESSLICIFHIRIHHKRSRSTTMVIETTVHDLSRFHIMAGGVGVTSQLTFTSMVKHILFFMIDHDTSWYIVICTNTFERGNTHCYRNPPHDLWAGSGILFFRSPVLRVTNNHHNPQKAQMFNY